MKCGACSLYFHPYQSCCSACLSGNVAPAPVSGRGTVLSSTINHQPWFPHVPVPYVVALVELEEKGPVRLLTNMFGEPVESIVPGLRVSVHFEQHDNIFVPLFRSEEHTSELQSLMRISYAVFCLKKKKKHTTNNHTKRTRY